MNIPTPQRPQLREVEAFERKGAIKTCVHRYLVFLKERSAHIAVEGVGEVSLEYLKSVWKKQAGKYTLPFSVILKGMW